jgi:hypothetical protein
MFGIRTSLPIRTLFLSLSWCKFQTIRCPKNALKTSFQLEISCSADDLDAIEFCAMPHVKLQTKTANSSVDFNYVIDDDDFCFRVMKNVKMVKFVANQFAVLYGCVATDEDKHEEGAWILGFKNNTAESLKHLNEAFKYLNNSLAKFEDFKVFNVSRANNLTANDVREIYSLFKSFRN